MVSMASIHFFSWAEQLKNSGHEVYWVDIFDSGIKNPRIDFVDQTVGWRNRFDFPGRYYLKTKVPKVYSFINIINQRNLSDVFNKKMEEIKPDLVHSFVMYAGTVPLLKVMKNYPKTKWAYSAWGNDLFFYQGIKEYKEDMEMVFPYIDFMFADCTRDYHIAKEYGFKGKYLGTYPTGGGYDLKTTDPLISKRSKKNTILIKGYEHKFGRCINILRAINPLKKELENYKIVIFGANQRVFDYISNSDFKDWRNLEVHGSIGRGKVLKLMGASLIYIGNSISDGMPNTLLEAIIMEVFPIQSNPGGATAEIIENELNGLLINNPEKPDEIKDLLQKALVNPKMIKKAIAHNCRYVKPKLEREIVMNEVVKKYDFIETTIMD